MTTTSSTAPSIDLRLCLENGAIGACGGVPGTIFAHPFDVIKCRQQIHGGSVTQAFRFIHGGASMAGNAANWMNFSKGLLPAVQQKVVTRAPMFFVSSMSVQFCERALGFAATPAAFIGSFASGYATGSLASLPEWRKVKKLAFARPFVTKVFSGLTSLSRATAGSLEPACGRLWGAHPSRSRVGSSGKRRPKSWVIECGEAHPRLRTAQWRV